nr:PEPxxWA-CTERM sorting domain-containing protein [uncultured Sphingomonas sp.]
MASYWKLVAAVSLAGLAVPSEAATVVFSGRRTNVDAPGPAAERCGSRATSNIRNEPPLATASGTSNLGDFTPTLSHCLTLPLSNVAPNLFDLGEFLFAFENGDTLFGTYSGELNFVSAGVYSVFQTHLVTGGTGTFLDASGSFTSGGQLTFPLGRPTVTQQFSGLLNLPAVPEPGTWATMLLGFGVIGSALRSRRARRRLATPA